MHQPLELGAQRAPGIERQSLAPAAGPGQFAVVAIERQHRVVEDPFGRVPA